MATTLVDRLGKLHEDALCCLEDFRHTREQIVQDEPFVDALTVLSALGDEKRLSIVMLLQRFGELCACEIEAAFDLSHSTVMHHLNVLAGAGIIDSRRDGRWSHYRLADGVPVVLDTIKAYIGVPNREPSECCSCSTTPC